MDPVIASPHQQTLQRLMQVAEIDSLSQLASLAGVPLRQLLRLHYGLLAQLPVGVVWQLSQALGITISELLAELGLGNELRTKGSAAQMTLLEQLQRENAELQQQLVQQRHTLTQAEATLQTQVEQQQQQRQQLTQEYERLQAQTAVQMDQLQRSFQQDSLKTLESWLLQWPTASAIAQQNPQFPAQKLIPLAQPMVQLVQDWGVEPLAAVGEELAYDPQQHELMDGEVQPGDPVTVRYVGYHWQETLLYRAKVSPVPSETESND